MKLMINIPDEAYELLKSKSELDNIAESIIANGTPISTEGDLISRPELKKAIIKRLGIKSEEFLLASEQIFMTKSTMPRQFHLIRRYTTNCIKEKKNDE